MSLEITEDELNKRQAYIDELKSFLTEQQEKISLSLETLGWTPEHFIKPQNKVTCPLDSGHVMPEESLEKHLETCKLLKNGVAKYSLGEVLDEKKRIQNTPTNIVKLDEAILNSVLWNNAVECGQVYTGQRKLPITHEEDTIILNPHERLAVHDYVVSEAKSNGLMLNVEKDESLTTDWEKIIKKGVLKSEENKDSLTPVEKLAAIRDFKRRRQTYRAKNVHITRKSYTEIIHEVIENQMEMWGAEIQEETGNTEKHMEITLKTEDGNNREKGSDKDSYSERGSERDRHRERGFDRERYREQGSDRDRDRGSDRDRDRGSDRDRHIDRYSDKDRYRKRDSDRNRRRDKYRDRSRARDRSRDRDRSRNRDRSRDRDKSRRKDRSELRERDRHEDKESSRSESLSSDVKLVKNEVTPDTMADEIKSRVDVTNIDEEMNERLPTNRTTTERSREDTRHHKKSKKHKHKHKKHKRSSISPDSQSSSSVK